MLPVLPLVALGSEAYAFIVRVSLASLSEEPQTEEYFMTQRKSGVPAMNFDLSSFIYIGRSACQAIQAGFLRIQFPYVSG